MFLGSLNPNPKSVCPNQVIVKVNLEKKLKRRKLLNRYILRSLIRIRSLFYLISSSLRLKLETILSYITIVLPQLQLQNFFMKQYILKETFYVKPFCETYFPDNNEIWSIFQVLYYLNYKIICQKSSANILRHFFFNFSA